MDRVEYGMGGEGRGGKGRETEGRGVDEGKGKRKLLLY